VAEFGGRIPQYETFANEFLEHAEDAFYNAHYDRPACLALLGDVQEVWSRGWQLRYWLYPLEPEEYARLHRQPRGFLAIRAVPRP
jgi:hypothetical protein